MNSKLKLSLISLALFSSSVYANTVDLDVEVEVKNTIDITCPTGINFGVISALADTSADNDTATISVNADAAGNTLSTPGQADGAADAADVAANAVIRVVDNSAVSAGVCNITGASPNTILTLTDDPKVAAETLVLNSAVLQDSTAKLLISGVAYFDTTNAQAYNKLSPNLTTDANGDVDFHVGATLKLVSSAVNGEAQIYDAVFSEQIEITVNY